MYMYIYLVGIRYAEFDKLNSIEKTAYVLARFNPRGGAGGQMPPLGFAAPQAYNTINNPSPARPNVPPKFLQLLILPPSRTHV